MNKFSYYKGGIIATTPAKHITIEDFLKILETSKYKKYFELIRSKEIKEERNSLKKKLSYITPAGVFKTRSVEGLKESSGLACLDYDDVKDLESLKEKISKDKYTHLVFVSPSGQGLKLVVKIPKTKTNEEYKGYWSAIARHFNIEDNDEGTKDISRACYISYDKDYYYNPDSEIFTDKIESLENISTEKTKKEKNKIDFKNHSQDFLDKNIITKLSKDILKLILSEGEKGKRSERDEKIIVNLLLNGFGDYIFSIFENYPCGEKYRTHPSPQAYLEKSIENARKFSGVNDDFQINLEKEIEELPDSVLKNKIDSYLIKIDSLENVLIKKKILGSIAFRLTIPKKDLISRTKELNKPKIKKPVKISSLFDNPIEEIKYYVNPLIPQNFCILLGGKASKFKSGYLLSQLLSISLNKPYLNQFEIDKKPKILLYDLENGERITTRRLNYFLNGMGAKAEDIKDFDITYNFDKNDLKAEVELSKDYDLICIDTYRRVLLGAENDSEVNNKFFEEFLKPLKAMGKTIIILHHFKKQNLDDFSDDSLMDLFRGSSDIPAQFELVLGVFKTPEKLTGTTTQFDVSIAKVKNREAIPIKDFLFKVLKDDSKIKTTFDFEGFEKLKSQKEQIKDSIIDYLSLKEKSRKEISEKFADDFGVSKWTIIKYLEELKKEKIITSTKYGTFSLVSQVIENAEGGQATLK